MFLNLLAAAFDPSLKDKKIPVGEAAIDAVVGLAVAILLLLQHFHRQQRMVNRSLYWSS